MSLNTRSLSDDIEELERAAEPDMRRIMHCVSVRGWPPQPAGRVGSAHA